MSSSRQSFLETNAALWDRLPSKPATAGILLVEEQRHPIITHANAVFSRIINEARGLRIAWIDPGDVRTRQRLRSYDPTALIIPRPRLSPSDFLLASGTFLRAMVVIRTPSDLLDFEIRDLRLGDIMYDTHLAHQQLATINRIGPMVLRTVWRTIRDYFRFRRIILRSGASALLVSHEVGSSGILMRAGLQLGRPVFHRASGVQLNLKLSLDQLYENRDRPLASDLDSLARRGPERVEREFKEVMESRVAGGSDEDAAQAYGTKKVYSSKLELARDMSLSPEKPFVFVMLHAFNDHPHSHYGPMLFRDYYDWFAQTLRFAWHFPDVNWLFKEHPSADWYPTRDVRVADSFQGSPDHVVFLPKDADFSTRSLFHVADAVVTVAGTAGVEVPASASIPSILAGSSSYSGFGFTVEPRTVDEYFSTLRRVATLPRLTLSQRKQARAVFLFQQRYAAVPFTWLPELDYENERDLSLDDYFWDAVSAVYADREEQLIAEYRAYVEQVRRPDFLRLSCLP